MNTVTKGLCGSSVLITDNLEVRLSKVIYKQGKSEAGDWTCFEIWFESLEDNTLVTKIFRPKLTAISRAFFAKTLKSIIDCLDGAGTWDSIERFNSWNTFDTYIIEKLSRHIDEKVYIKTLAEKDYFDTSKVTAVLADNDFISKTNNLSYSMLELNKVQDYYIPAKKKEQVNIKNINRHFN